MLKEQFEIAAAETRIRTPNLLNAARAVLVDKALVSEVAEQYGLRDTSPIYRAVGTIERKWEQICERRGWSYLPLTLPKRLMRAMLEIQAGELADYLAELDKRKKKKKSS